MLEIVLYIAVLIALTPVIGGYMARVFRGDAQWLGFVERPLYRLLGVDPARGQDWKGYARSILVFSVAGAIVLYVIVRAQGATWDLTFNTTASFVTNTNWQFYAGESTLSNFAQMAGLAVQNFLSAGVGIAVLVAFIRGLASRSGKEIGVFYVDLARTLLYILLPLSIVVGLVLVSQGVIQSLSHGPVASQEAIKMLGTNGGGFFNVNSAHPFENPTWLSNFVEMLAILIIPAGLTSTYGRMVDNRRQGWMVFGAMMALFIVAVAVI
jgi:potassium-transporting ATPase potassium-binding subunit